MRSSLKMHVFPNNVRFAAMPGPTTYCCMVIRSHHADVFEVHLVICRFCSTLARQYQLAAASQQTGADFWAQWCWQNHPATVACRPHPSYKWEHCIGCRCRSFPCATYDMLHSTSIVCIVMSCLRVNAILHCKCL